MPAVMVLMVLLVPVTALAETAAKEPSLFTASLKMLAALGVVVGLLLLFYAASRRGFGFLPQNKSEIIQIIETRPLGGRKFLCVVKVRDEEILLGMTHDRIENLGRLEPAKKTFSDSLHAAQEKQP
ncbi:flagellar biosynthetic protein FliO [Pelovirga terrestris]|uniref:Flagellar biosynthetic protein FliO n=1 Tax=Pelovirga terrestris TaxID=2771352 RepID=A0A8J6UP66_9BACT|nr:flagellar biosynthetic protein FliO [Pelovirga terrestris]MBD1400439.1 flagellar biosynthetic protein FliO [Pelovirga terrestris]